MKRIMVSLAFLACVMAADAQQINTPAPSTTQTVTQTFGLGKIELSYSRPSMKGRKVMGDLVPFDKVWRTGANNATTITFSDDVEVGGKAVKAGKYGLLTIPGAKNWTVIITKDLNVTSPAAYNQANDVARVSVPSQQMPMSMETFTIVLDNISNTSCDLSLLWENTIVTVPITTDVDKKVMAQIDNALNKDTRPYYQAATYYYETNRDLNKAAEWIAKAVDQNPNAYWVRMAQARILAKKGDKAGAKASALQVVDLATKAKNDDYVKMANELIAGL